MLLSRSARGVTGWCQIGDARRRARRWRPHVRSPRHQHQEEWPITDQPYELASLGDLIEYLVDGWRIERLYYADSCAPLGSPDVPGAFIELRRPAGGRLGVYIPDDGRAFSHRALVALFREQPAVWKHARPGQIPYRAEPPPGAPRPPEDWAEVAEPFPESLAFGPETLRSVIAVNQVETADGLTIAASALEIFDDGARLRYLVQGSDADARGRIALLDALAIDDAARLYRVAQLPTERHGLRLDCALALAPAPPLDASRLTITIGTVEGPDDGPLSGPWVFPMHLRDRE
jgi:hypothetical protein